MKLQATKVGKKNKEREDNFNDLYHNCRWCKYYDKKEETCKHPSVLEAQTDTFYNAFYNLSEKGDVQTVVQEALEDREYTKFADNLVTGCMKKLKLNGTQADRLRQIFFNVGEEFINDVSVRVDEALLNKVMVEDCSLQDGYKILDSERHCCDKWE